MRNEMPFALDDVLRNAQKIRCINNTPNWFNYEESIVDINSAHKKRFPPKSLS